MSISIKREKINKLIIFLKSKIFIFKSFLYRKFNRNQVKKRLFLTTGNISLINALAAIKQKSDYNELYEDYLYVWSVNKNPEFKECCMKMASLHSFKEVYFFEDFLHEQLYSFSLWDHKRLTLKNLLDLDLFKMDEIFSVNVLQFIYSIKKIFNKIPVYMIEESAFGKFSKGKYNNVINFIMPTYLGKIDYRGFSQRKVEKFEELKFENFIEIADKCEKFYPLNIDSKPEDKIIIFCGTWGGLQQYSANDIVEMQCKYIDKLRAKGYVVFFKPHPRDINVYQELDSFKILNTRLPLECYTFNNVVAIVSLYSYSSLQSYHYRRIPGFICWDKLDIKPEASLTLIREYTPSLDLIMDINPQDFSCSKLKSFIESKYLQFLNSKPMLSKNPEFDKFYK